MSFAELISLKEKLGTKVYNEAMFGEAAPKPKKPTKAELKRENKNRPREATAKKTVPFLGKKKFTRKDEATRSRDPRFDEKCGEYDKKKFKEDYSFMSEIREREIGELKAKLRDKETNGEEKTKIRLLIQRMNNQNLEAKKLKQREAALNDEKKVVQEARKQEKLPFYSTKRKWTISIRNNETRRNGINYKYLYVYFQARERQETWSSNTLSSRSREN